MTFAEPHYFWAMAALPVLVFFFIQAERLRRRALDMLLAARLQPRLAGSVSVGRRRFAFALLLAGLALCIVALARPRWGVTFEEQSAVGRDVLIAMDTSRSMLARDVAPNRLERAKFAALDLLRELEGDKVGLVAFAGDAFLQAPLTPDRDSIEKSLRDLDTEAISQGGSNLALAIETAAEAFGKGESDQRALIFFSDGEELQQDALEAATKYKDKFRIYTIGVGTAEGGPIVMQTRFGSEYIRDEGGNIVTTKLDESRLQEVAKRAGGFYLRLQNGPADMRDLAQRGLGTMREKETGTLKREIPNERFQWPLVGGIVALMISVLLGERRRVARVAAVALLLCIPHPAEAGRVGRGLSRLLGGEEDTAPKKEETPEESVRRLEGARNQRPGVPELEYNVGCAAFAAGDYDKAASAFSTALGSGVPDIQAKAAYNLANSLARRGVKAEKEKKIADWTNALQQYDHALNLQPGNEDAKTNRAIVQKALDALKEQEKKEQEQQKKEDEEKKDQKKDSSGKQDKDNKGEKGEKSKQDEKQNGDGKEGEKKEGENKEGEPKEGEKPDEKKTDDKKTDDKKTDDKKTDDKKEGEEKGEEKKGGSKDGPKPGEENKGDNADAGKPRKPAEPADQTKPQDVKPNEKAGEQPKDGDLKPAGEPMDNQDAKEAAEEAQAAREGRMTEKDAKQLLQSMRRHEGLLRPQKLVPQRRPIDNGKNW